MFPFPRGAVWQTLFLLCAVLFINEVRSEGRVVCYYTNWSVYRPGTAKFNPQNINPYLCTHLVYAFGGFTKDNAMKPFDKYQDIEQGGYAKFTGLKTYNKQLKTMIAIGGWNEASSRFSPLVASQERRQKFIKNILKFLRQNHFDGIDLDWEYPANREGGKSRDKDNYAQFVQELRAEFDRESEKTGRPRLLLTMAVPAGIENIDKGYDIPKLNKYLDWFNILSYDFHTSNEPAVNHHAPLYSLEEESEYNYDTELNIDFSVKYYLQAGADRDKIVLGIPTYGRSYTLINEESNEIGAPADGPGDQGDATREKGYLAYYEICQNIKEDPEWTVVKPNSNAMGPYAYRGNQWVGYDDEDIVRKKAEYVVENGLGGIMFWAIDNDDFRGICTGKPYPLIEAAKETMLDRIGLGANEVAKPTRPKKPLRSRSRVTSSSRNRINEYDGDKSTSSSRKEATRRPVSHKHSTTTEPPRKTSTTPTSLYIGGRHTTPPPPTTPDPGADFRCEEEGFFQHPRDCKKYFWCLDSGPSNLGIVAHQFTCPSGLYFNPAADSCDFSRNVPCKKNSKAAGDKPESTTTSTTTTTTPRTTTTPISRFTAATSRNTYLRSSSTTTSAPEEEYEDEEEEVDVVSSPGREHDAEEDPRVIKELIELIRKVGGIEELEKHILEKDDGTIMFKNGGAAIAAADTPTTPSSISKSLYDKVLSRPNNLSSFRNRFTSSTQFRSTKQKEKTETTAVKDELKEDIFGSSSDTKGKSKYSSVLRGNSRQGPQNAGIDKLPEFEGFLKEKKQYVTITRNRPSLALETDDEEDSNNQERSLIDRISEETEEENVTKGSRLFVATSTPTYTSIRRSRPTTLKVTSSSNDDESVEDQDEQSVGVGAERKSYSSLNRNRGRFTTESSASTSVTESTTLSATRHKLFERSRPTRKSIVSTTGDAESGNDDDDDDNDDEEDSSHNVTVQLSEANAFSTQPQTTTRAYANIGRRTTITTTTPVPSTITANFLDETTTTTTTPELITTTNADLIATTIPTPIITASPASTPTNDNLLESTPFHLDAIESVSPVGESDSLTLSVKLNSLQTSANNFSTESGLDTSKQESYNNNTISDDDDSRTKSTATTSTTRTTDTDIQNVDEVTNHLTKTIRTKPGTTTNTTKTISTPTTTTKDINSNKISSSSYNSASTSSLNLSSNNGNSNSSSSSSRTSIRGNSVKYNGGRRQQQTNTLNRRSQTQPTTVPITNEFLGTVSSPRPFGFPKRRTRPTTTSTSTSIDDDSDEESFNSSLTFDQRQEQKSFSANTKKNRSPASTQTATTIFTSAQAQTAISRRPVLSVRRRLITTTTSATDTADNEATTTNTEKVGTAANVESVGGGDSTSSTLFKYNRRTRPSYLTTKLKSSSEMSAAASASSSSLVINSSDLTDGMASDSALAVTSANDISQKPTQQKYLSPAIRRKFNNHPTSLATSTFTNNNIVASIRRSTTPAPEESASTDPPRTPNPLFKRRYTFTTPLAPPISTTFATAAESNTATPLYIDSLEPEDGDQIAKSSIQDSKFINNRFNQISEALEDNADLTSGIKTISHDIAPTETTHVTLSTVLQDVVKKSLTISKADSVSEEPITRRMGVAAVSTRRPSLRRPQKSTPSPAALTKAPVFVSRRRPHKIAEPFEKLNSKQQTPGRTYRPIVDYDYYDDEDVRVVDKQNAQQVKVVLHGRGIIECLDQGNFPHPLSCRKFISCAKFETGGVVGWEYTCPKGLSYDPVGGMCNWAAGLGCKE